MTIGKITISKLEAMAISVYLTNYRGDKASLLDKHAQYVKWFEPYTALNNLSQADLARALLIGYDVEVEYKAGDWVAVDWFDNGLGIYKVVGVESNGEVVIDNGDLNNNPGNKFIQHATPEEIKAEKERQLWDKLGRKVGEFKVGDVRITRRGSVTRTYFTNEADNEYREGHLIGFYPAESFVSFEEGEEE